MSDVETEKWHRRGVTEVPVEGRRHRGRQANPASELNSDSTPAPSGNGESAGNHAPEKIR